MTGIVKQVRKTILILYTYSQHTRTTCLRLLCVSKEFSLQCLWLTLTKSASTTIIATASSSRKWTFSRIILCEASLYYSQVPAGSHQALTSQFEQAPGPLESSLLFSFLTSLPDSSQVAMAAVCASCQKSVERGGKQGWGRHFIFVSWCPRRKWLKRLFSSPC